ncbi:MAG TPA: GyrI-like domain-containing protein [Humisphaera sp.]
MGRLRVFIAAVLGSALLAGCARTGRTLAPHRPVTLPTTGPLTKPVLPPLSQPAFGVTEPAERTLDAVPRFVYVGAETTFKDIAGAVERAMADLSAAQSGGRFRATGPVVMVYRGATADPDKPFTLEVGMPAEDGPPPGGRVRARPLPAMKAVAVEFTGPLSAIDKAYDRLMPAVQALKREPTGETREVYLNWDGPTSANNRVLVGAGVR